MATLAYIGRVPDSDGTLIPKSYADSTNAASALTTTWVNNAIAAVTPTLTTQSYVDTQNALLAQKSQVTQADQIYAATSVLNAANGVAGLDAGGNLISSQLPTGVITDRVMQCYSLSVPSIIYDNHAAASGLKSTTGVIAWTHTALPGATVVADLIVGGGLAPPTYTVNGVTTAMTKCYNAPSDRGTLARYFIQNVTGGDGVINWGNPGQVWFSGASVSYLNVGSVGTTTHITQFPSSSYNLSTPGGMAVICATQDNWYTNGLTGGTLRAASNSSFTSIAIADSAVAASFTATSATDGLATILNPSISSTGLVGTVSFAGSVTVAANAAPVRLAALLVPDPGYPWRPIPFAWVR